MKIFSKKILLPFFLIIFLILLWEFLSRLNIINTLFLPPPSSIAEALFKNWKIIVSHTSQTLLETFIGLLLSILLGLIGAIILASSSIIRQMFYPILLISQTIPMIVLSPLLLLSFGFGITPKVIVVILYCVFPIIVATTDALINVDTNLINLLKSMDASKLQILKHVRLPAVLPAFFSGLKISVTYCLTGAIAGEYVGAEKGLGILMKLATNSHAFSFLYASIFVTVFLSVSLFGIFTTFEKIIFPWIFEKNKKINDVC